MYHLKVSHLEKAFTLHLLKDKQISALRDVSFEVAPGEFLGIIGRSGSGKSSLLKCIYRTYLPTSGSVLYSYAGNTYDMSTMSANEIVQIRATGIGYVSQFLRPIPRVTAIKLVAEPLLNRGVGPSEAHADAAEFLGRLNLAKELWDSYPVFFSGGEQQRVNLARALTARSSMLLLDEPTASLDAHNQEAVVSVLRQAKNAGTTMLGVFHDNTVLHQLADRILVLDHGTVETIEEAQETWARDKHSSESAVS